MSKYFNDGIAPVPFSAGEDLTSWQYKLVILTGSAPFTVERSTTASAPAAIGVLQNDPSANQEAAVKCVGFTKAKARVNSTCQLNPGTFLFGASDGLLEPVPVATGCPAVARWFDERQTTVDASYIGNVYFFGVSASLLNS